MLRKRIIPCLLLSNGGLVKTHKFRSPKYVGDPVNAIRIYNEKQVDELIVLDIDASRHGRGPDFALIEQFASECFMPLCYGGGVATLDHATTLFSLGVEKVCLQSAALERPHLISEIASRFGSQSVVVSVDVARSWMGARRLRIPNHCRAMSLTWEKWVTQLESLGAGEVVLSSVERDGTLSGMDIELVRKGTALTGLPVIALGGASSLNDMNQAINSGASAAAAGALFVFHGPHNAVLITYPSPEEIDRISEEAR